MRFHECPLFGKWRLFNFSRLFNASEKWAHMDPYGIIWALSLMTVKIVAFFNLAFSLNLGNSNSVELKIRHAQTRSNTKYEMRLHEITNLAMGAGPASPVGQPAGHP